MSNAEGNTPERDENVNATQRLDQARAELEQGDGALALNTLSRVAWRKLPRPLQLRYRYLRGWALTQAWRYQQAHRELAVALRLAERLDEREYAARISYRIGLNYYRQGQFAQAERCFMRAWSAIYDGEVGDLLFRMYVDHSLGNCALRLGRFDEAASHYHDALSYGADVDDRKWVGSVYLGLGLAYLHQGEFALAKLAMEESLHLEEQVAADSFLVEISAMYAITLIELNQPRAAEQELRRTIYLSTQVGNHRTLAIAYGCLAEAHLADGRLSEALASAEQALAEAEHSEVSLLDRAQLQLVLAKVQAAAGEQQAADGAFAVAEQGMSQSGDEVKYAALLRDYAKALISWGEHERAAAKLEAAYSLLRPRWRELFV